MDRSTSSEESSRSSTSAASLTSTTGTTRSIHQCKAKQSMTARGMQPYVIGSNWRAWKFAFGMAIKARDAENDTPTPDDKILVILLSTIGTDAINDLLLWTAPGLPSDKTLKEVYEILDSQYGTHTQVQLNRLRLFELKQGDKDIREYYREVNKVAGKCALESMTDVRLAITALAFIKGITDPYIKERLLDPVNDAKTGNELLSIALAAGTAKEAISFANPERKANAASRYARSSKNSSRNRETAKCRNCGKTGHTHKDCYRAKTCSNCKKDGHISKYCRSKESRRANKVQQSYSYAPETEELWRWSNQIRIYDIEAEDHSDHAEADWPEQRGAYQVRVDQRNNYNDHAKTNENIYGIENVPAEDNENEPANSDYSKYAKSDDKETAKGDNYSSANGYGEESAESDDEKFAETNHMKSAECEDKKTAKSDNIKYANGYDDESAESEVKKTAKSDNTKSANGYGEESAESDDVNFAETNHMKSAESEDKKTAKSDDKKTAKSDNIKFANSYDDESAESDDKKFAESNYNEYAKSEVKITAKSDDRKFVESDDIKAAKSDNSKLAEVKANESAMSDDAEGKEPNQVKDVKTKTAAQTEQMIPTKFSDLFTGDTQPCTFTTSLMFKNNIQCVFSRDNKLPCTMRQKAREEATDKTPLEPIQKERRRKFEAIDDTDEEKEN